MPDIPRMVLIVAPHTSNWDFRTGLWIKLATRMGAASSQTSGSCSALS